MMRNRPVPRPSAEDRLGRLLAIVPWVAAHDGPEVAEVCRRFGVGEKDLLEDLNLLFLCGIYPYTPDVLIDVDVADGRVWIRMADYFRRPLRLSPQEALALASAGAALLSVPGADPDGALATAMAKLEDILGVAAEDVLDVQLDPVAPTVLSEVRRAVASHRKVELDYYSFGRDGHSTRVVQPERVFNAAGQWYLSGWCESAGGERLFRVDRISRAEMLVATFEPRPRPPVPPTGVYHPRPTDARLVLDLDPPAHWIAEQYPNDGVEVVGPSVLRVALRTSHRAWVARLLLRAGPHARVVEGDGAAGAEAAARVLGRYRR
jgi:proteasome accessory factor C